MSGNKLQQEKESFLLFTRLRGHTILLSKLCNVDCSDWLN